jgi:Leucine-rich repeat (LRR) protein
MNQMVNMRDFSIHHVQSADSEPVHSGLSGPILTFGDMPFLTLLFLDGNSLSGTIPLDFLRHNNNVDSPLNVGLSNNNITGAIPKTLERFESLSIDLVGNRITEIPPELCEKGGWMGGLVEEYKCNAILCGENSYSLEGRADSEETTCKPCPDTYPYLGAKQCSTDASQQTPWKVLAGFYLAMAGEKWTIRNGWEIFDTLVNGGVTEDLESLDIDVCDGWHGISCEDGEVTRISLPKNELFGNVPDAVFSFASLEVFDLSNNNIQMKSLQGAARATGLKSLFLSNIKLESLSGIGDLGLLEQLYLDGLNILGTLPDELFGLTGLRTLHLQHGSFTGTLPTLVGKLTQLAW